MCAALDIRTVLASETDWDLWLDEVRTIADAYGIWKYVVSEPFPVTGPEEPASADVVLRSSSGKAFKTDGSNGSGGGSSSNSGGGGSNSWQHRHAQYVRAREAHGALLLAMKRSLALEPETARAITAFRNTHALYDFLAAQHEPLEVMHLDRLRRAFRRLAADANVGAGPWAVRNVDRAAWLRRWWWLHKDVMEHDEIDLVEPDLAAEELRKFYVDFRFELCGDIDPETEMEYLVYGFDKHMGDELTFCRINGNMSRYEKVCRATKEERRRRG